MKTSKIQKRTSSNSHSSKPFFNKSGEGSFFSQTKESENSFFSPYPIQTKLTVDQPNDKYEQEADMTAEKAVRKLENSSSSLPIQRKCEKCEQEEKLQKKEEDSEEREVMRKHIFESDDDSQIQTKSIENQLNTSKGKGDQLPKDVRSNMESVFGTDFSNVKIHTDSNAIQMSREFGAKAFTRGSDIYFNERQYNPESFNGKRLIAHELTHVRQQTGFIQKKSVESDDCPDYETGEIARSRTESGYLDEDVVLHRPGELLIADYGNDWGSPKDSAKNHPLLRYWLGIFEADPTYRISIFGYSDCIGDDSLNTFLRRRRARKIKRLLGPMARSRVSFVGMQSLGNYVFPNESPYDRAKNRGVIIKFKQNIEFNDAEGIKADPFCGPESTDWLIRQMTFTANDSFTKGCQKAFLNRYSQNPYKQLKAAGAIAGCFAGFKGLVESGGLYDFKSRQRRWKFKNGRLCPSKLCDQTMMLCGHCLNYDVPGNIHYGWFGRKLGIRKWVLHRGAAYAQKGGVDPKEDTVAINIGIKMADKGAALCPEILAHLSELNRERNNGKGKTENCADCSKHKL